MDQVGISMDFAKVNIIAIWSMPESFQNIQVFLEFANFYHKFIEVFSKITSDFSNMLKNNIEGKFKSMKFVFIGKARLKEFKN